MKKDESIATDIFISTSYNLVYRNQWKPNTYMNVLCMYRVLS